MANEQLSDPVRQPEKSWKLALFLSAFLGMLAIDRFYLGKIGTGILKLLTVGGFGIWWLVDFILLAWYDVRDGQGNPLDSEESQTKWRVAGSATVIFVAAGLTCRFLI